jgi:hypothetical protein
MTTPPHPLTPAHPKHDAALPPDVLAAHFAEITHQLHQVMLQENAYFANPHGQHAFAALVMEKERLSRMFAVDAPKVEAWLKAPPTSQEEASLQAATRATLIPLMQALGAALVPNHRSLMQATYLNQHVLAYICRHMAAQQRPKQYGKAPAVTPPSRIPAVAYCVAS